MCKWHNKENGEGKTYVLVQGNTREKLKNLEKVSINCDKQVGEEDKTICDNVDESLILENVVEGPPASGCEQDGERQIHNKIYA